MGVLLGLSIAIAVLLIVLALMADSLIRAHAALQQHTDAGHAACIAHIADVTSKRFGAVIVRDLARRYESGEEIALINRIKREQWKPEGKALPVLWLEHRADLMDPPSTCDEHEHTFAGECRP